MTDKLRIFLESAFYGKQDDVINWAISKAYSDLKRNIKYMYSIEKLNRMPQKDREKFNKLKRDFYDGAVNIISNGIQTEKSPYNVIMSLYEDTNSDRNTNLFRERFTIGLAQKWINMSYKYLWLIDKCPINEVELDAPLDDYIITAITQGKKGNNEYGIMIKLENPNPDSYIWNPKEIIEKGSIKGKKWSKLDDITTYTVIQKSIREAIKRKYNSVIEWENYAWTRQRIIEKNK